MPKQIMDSLLRAIRRDIRTNYAIGDRYLTIQQIAAANNVSTQTAQRAIGILAGQGIVKAVPRSGITILSREENRSLAGKKIALVSKNAVTAINQAALEGIREAAGPLGVASELVIPPADLDPRGIGFGHFMAGLDADGIIGHTVYHSFLPIYHVMREGIDIVTDFAMPELPSVPSLQYNSRRHGETAGRTMRDQGLKNILIIGATDFAHSHSRGIMIDRYNGFQEGFKPGEDGRRIAYINVTQPDQEAHINAFFQKFDATCGVFSLQSGTNWLCGNKFLEFGIRVERDNFLVNNDMVGDFMLKGLPPVRSVSPSLKEVGAALALKLIRRWQTGSFAEPLAELL